MALATEEIALVLGIVLSFLTIIEKFITLKKMWSERKKRTHEVESPQPSMGKRKRRKRKRKRR